MQDFHRILVNILALLSLETYKENKMAKTFGIHRNKIPNGNTGVAMPPGDHVKNAIGAESDPVSDPLNPYHFNLLRYKFIKYGFYLILGLAWIRQS